MRSLTRYANKKRRQLSDAFLKYAMFVWPMQSALALPGPSCRLSTSLDRVCPDKPVCLRGSNEASRSLRYHRQYTNAGSHLGQSLCSPRHHVESRRQCRHQQYRCCHQSVRKRTKPSLPKPKLRFLQKLFASHHLDCAISAFGNRYHIMMCVAINLPHVDQNRHLFGIHARKSSSNRQ
jgi:hypothetical protein